MVGNDPRRNRTGKGYGGTEIASGRESPNGATTGIV